MIKPLRTRGFMALTTREPGQLQNGDADQLSYAVRRRDTFLTQKRADYEALAKHDFATRKSHLRISIAVCHPAQEIVSRLLRILAKSSAESTKLRPDAWD